MAGLNLARDNSRASDNNIVNRASANASPVKTIRGMKTFPTKIETARQAVEQYLGDKRNEYGLVSCEGDLYEYVASATMNTYVAIDTETTGLDPLSDEIVGLSLYIKNECSLAPQLPPCYIPLNHRDYTTGERCKDQISMEDMAWALEEMINAGCKFIFFNAKFDTRVIKNRLGVKITPYFDAYIAARLLNENEPDNGLKALHKKYVMETDEDAFSFSQLFDKIPFDLVPIDVGYLYAARDALVTYELFEFQLPYLTLGTDENTEQELQGVQTVFWKIEMPIIPVVAEMEDRGVKFDFEYQKQLSEEYNEELKKAEESFYEKLKEYTDKEYSISSPLQLATLFYDDLKIAKPVYDRKSGKYKRTVDAELLTSLNHPLAKIILEYRACAKLISTYVDKMAVIAQRDGRVHGSFNQVGTDTGRFSSSNPNLQNIPSHNTKIRKMFIPSDGYVFVGGDMSAQEPRLTAHLSGDERMIQAYRDGKDLYCEIASLAFRVPYEQCLEFNPDGTKNPEGKERRSIAKKIVLSINYGKGIKSLAEDLNKTIDEAKEIYAKVMKQFPDLEKFIVDSKDMAYNKGYVTTLFGRKRRLPDVQLPQYEFSFTDGGLLAIESEKKLTRKLNSMRFDERKAYIEESRKNGIIIKDNNGFIARAERQCVNARVQGSAGDQVKIIMQKIANDDILRECGFHLLLQIHDEVIGECPRENAKVAKERLKYIMEHAMDGVMLVPSKADIECTDRWYGEEINL